ncbi:MAG: hypothetical protein ACNA8W_19830, partial [Bradymonadaceae bacterium]
MHIGYPSQCRRSLGRFFPFIVLIAAGMLILSSWGCGPGDRDRGDETPLVICATDDCEDNGTPECDPEVEDCSEPPDGGVNAEACFVPTDCTSGYFCVDQECLDMDEACSDCEEGDECRYVSSSMTIRCDDPGAGCTAGDASCVDASTSRVCNTAEAVYENIGCGSRGCNSTTGLCNRTAGDACFVAINATGGYSGSIQWSNFTNDYELEATSTCVSGDALYNTFGSDIAYVIDVPAGETLVATMQTPAGYGALYLTPDCSNIEASCLNPATNLTRQGDDYILTLSYKNETQATKKLYLIADSGFGVEQGPAQIEISTGELVCGPGSARCSGDVRETCSHSGMAYVTDMTCPFGCDQATQQCNAATNNDCAGALDILSAGGSFTGTLSDFTATYDPGSACPGFSRAPGRDALFYVDVNVGDRVRARMDADFDAVLWSMTNCGNPGPSCVAGSDSGNPEAIEFIAETAGRHFIVADAWTTTASGTFTLDVWVDEPTCTTQDEIIGCADANTLEFCADTGFSNLYTCSSTCSNSRCDVPKGDICFDAVPLNLGTPFTGQFSDYTNQFNPGTSTCIVSGSDSQIGRDAVFAIDLDAGEILEASIASSGTGVGMYILDECTSLTDVPSACVHARPRSTSLEFYAAEAGTYYLVVDSTSSSLSSSFTLTTNVRPGACQPDTGSCTNGTLTLCNLDGSQVLNSVTCAHGCTGNSCAGPTPANDTCPTAYARTSVSAGTSTSPRSIATSPPVGATPTPSAVVPPSRSIRAVAPLVTLSRAAASPAMMSTAPKLAVWKTWMPAPSSVTLASMVAFGAPSA